jgi:very-short-patch-repair endonuclease
MDDSVGFPAPGEPDFQQSRLVALASRQGQAVSARQLRGLGLTRGRKRGLVKRGQLHPIHHDVFIYGHPRPTNQGRLHAALLTCGPDSFLSHRTAAALWGVRSLNPFRIEVTVTGSHVPRRDGLSVHRTTNTAGAGEVSIRNGLRISTFARAMIELAPTETPEELDRLITEGVRKGVMDVEAFDQALKHHARRTGVAKLTEVFAGYRPERRQRSDIERQLRRLLAAAGLPEPRTNVHLGRWELDFYWPDFGVAVEVDGRPYHLAVRDQEKDKYKDTKLALMGVTVIRITDFRLEAEPQAVVADIRALLVLHGFPAG